MKTFSAAATLLIAVIVAQAQEAVRAAPVAAVPMIKKRIAVTHFDNKSNWQGQAELGTGFADSLADALIKTGRYIVVERAELQNVMKEQDFAQSGRTAETANAPQIGKLLTAQIQITGSILHVDTHTQEQSGAIGFRGFSIGGGGGKAEVAIALRIIDTTSGQVLDSQQIKGIARKSGMALGFAHGGFGGSMSSLNKTPLGDAVIDALAQAVAMITMRLEQVPWQGRIVKAEGDKILMPMLDSFEKGGFQGFGPSGMTYDWKAWDGTPWGYEGFLSDNYYALLAVLAREGCLDKSLVKRLDK